VVVRAASVGVILVTLAGCGGGTSAAGQAADQAFVNAVHSQASDISRYRNDTQLIRLGRAVCDGFASGVSYQQLADRMVVTESSGSLPAVPAEDLGTVITAAVQIFCPKYQNLVG
jgi:hypothetical protein